MGHVAPLHQCARGGFGIPNRTGTSLIRQVPTLAGATLALAGGLAAYPVVGIAPEWRPLIVVGLLGVLGLGLAMIVAWPQAVGWSLAALVAQYGLSLLHRSDIDRWSLLYLASLFVVSELSLAVIERRPVSSDVGPLHRFDLARIAALAAVACAVGGLVLLVATAPLAGWSWLPPLAVGAATAALWMVVTAAGRSATEPDSDRPPER